MRFCGTNAQLSKCGYYKRIIKLPFEIFAVAPNLVGDGGLEPPTSTMSTWRSTPELIALLGKSTFNKVPSLECPLS